MFEPRKFGAIRYMLHFVSLQQNGVHYLQVMKKEDYFDRSSYNIYLIFTLDYVHISG